MTYFIDFSSTPKVSGFAWREERIVRESKGKKSFLLAMPLDEEFCTKLFRRFSDGLDLLGSERVKRFQAIMQRYGTSPQGRKLIDEIFENLCGMTMADLVEQTAAAVLEAERQGNPGNCSQEVAL